MKTLTDADGRWLVACARKVITAYLLDEKRWRPEEADIPDAAHERRAVFVTLTLHGELRGCIGSLEAHESLLDNVLHNAWNAAFADPRFPALLVQELDAVHIDVSVLTPPQTFAVSDEQDLLENLRPGIDGLILSAPDGRRATFLPSVWEQLPEPAAFVAHLKRKAGLPAGYWHPAMKCERYEVQCFAEAGT